jgi:molybdopterin-guanine dinucleotide biosynthesis protein A
MNGKNKALMDIGGQSLVQRILGVFSPLFCQSFLVAKNPLDYQEAQILVVSDLYPVSASLAGLHAALFYSPTPWVFVCACDMPFIKKEMIGLLLSFAGDRFDVIVPSTSLGMEPLCALYSTRCLKEVSRCLAENRLKISGFFENVRVARIAEEKLVAVDPKLESFFNINTPEAHADAMARLEKAKGPCHD